MRLIYLLLILTIPFKVSAQIKPADQQYIPQENLLINPGYEQGRVNWTISGTATVSLEQTASAVLAGLSSLKIVASSQTFEVAQFTTKSAASLNGMQAMASVRVKSNQSGVQVCSIENSVHVKCVSVNSTNQAKEYIIPFEFNSTNNGIVIKGASGTGTTYIDDAYVGIMPASRMPEISQAHIVGVANIGGSNIAITTTQSSYTEITNASLDMVVTTGELKIPCSSTNASTGLTCSVGNESLGVVFNSSAGDYEVCSSFTVQTNAATLDSNLSFQYVETSNASQTIIQEGKTRVTVGANSPASNDQTTTPVTICGNFNFTLSGEKTIRLMYEKPLASTVNLNIDRSATNGQRDMSIVIKYFPPKSKVYSGATIYPHAQLWGTVSYAGSLNCIWSITSAAYSNFAADADCSNPTATGKINAPSTKIPAFVLPAGSPIGTYQIVTRAGFGGGASGGRNHYYRYSDGTRTSTSGLIYQSNSIPVQSEMSGQITYTSAITSDQTVQIQGGSSSGETTVNANSSTNLWGLTFEVYYFPPQENPIIGTFEGIEKCEDDFECTDVFSAKVSSAGVVSDENLNWINGNCTFSAGNVCSFNSGIFTVTPNCWLANTTNGINQSNVNGGQVYNLSTTGATFGSIDAAGVSIVARNQTVYCQKQGSDYKPKTAKAATTNEMMYVPNVTRPKTCYYAFGGASATLASPTVCAASPCVEVYDSCSAGTAPTRGGVGLYNDLTFANGTWKASTFIDCTVKSFTTSSGNGWLASLYFVTPDQTWMTNSSGGLLSNVFSASSTGPLQDGYIVVSCTADAP